MSALSLNRRQTMALMLGAAGMALTADYAMAAWPERTITITIPFNPGGGPDIFARIIAPHLSEALGESVVVQNKPGGGGNVALQALVDGDTDGYDVVINGVAIFVNPSLYSKLTYDPIADIQPVAGLVQTPFAVAVSTSRIKAETFEDFVAEVSADPGSFNAASGGSSGLIGANLLLQQMGVTTEIVPYPGTGDATASLIRGETDFLVTDPSALAAGIQSGAIRLLAIAGPERQPGYPDVPTTTELGYPDLQVLNAYGMYAKSGTPDDVIKRLNDEMMKIADIPEVKERFLQLNWIPRKMETEEWTEFYRAQVAKWKALVASAGIPTID